MGYVFEWWLMDMVAVTAVAIIILYLYVTRHFNYWKKRGAPYIKPTPLIGNCKDLLTLKRTAGHFLQDLYNKAPGKPYVGCFILDRPALVLRDPYIIKNILVKDFNYFADRFTSSDETMDPLGSKSLFLRKGQSWRHLRNKLTPTFSSGKMKNMFYLVTQCCTQLVTHLNTFVDTKNPAEIKDVLGRFTTDVISSCAFGIDSNSLQNPNAEFREIGKKGFDYTVKRAYETLVFLFFPFLVKLGIFSFFHKDVEHLLRKIFWETVQHREISKISRNDLIDLLIQIKNKGKIDDAEDDKSQQSNEKMESTFDFHGDDLAAQAALFFTAGFETSATTMSFTLYELAVHPEVQQKLRNEIAATLKSHGGEITFEAVHSMKYLDMVVAETLRIYPPLPFLDRICLKDYAVPGTNFTIEKGIPIYIPLLGIHHDAQIYTHADQYDPEHFNEENKKLQPPCTYLPFGEGPRNCIGMRFGLMTTKTGLVHILSQYEVEPSKDTPIPLVLNNRAVILASVGGIPLLLKTPK